MNGGESALDDEDVLYYTRGSSPTQLALDLNGILIVMEHRFYGNSTL
jgi:hypothetical protein